MKSLAFAEKNIDAVENKVNTEQSLVFNYSKLKLTEAMERLLNRGFNFSILPKKLYITQVEVDFKRLERSLKWQEFHFGSDDQ